jgi:hypothetical protein
MSGLPLPVASCRLPVSCLLFPISLAGHTGARMPAMPEMIDVRLALAMAVGGAVLLALVLFALAGRWRRWRGSAVARRRIERALRGESDAERLLERLGFAVLARQVGLEWAIACDGEDHVVELRADLVVERDGQRYVAEVKTGGSAPLLTNAATRRQLLEYCVAYDVDSVLLVDVEAGRVFEVSFPS